VASASSTTDFIAARALRLRQPGWRATESQLADLRSRDLDVLPVLGMPLRQLPDHVVQAVCDASGELLVPPPSRGLLRLREAISTKLARESALEVDPETDVVVTSGAMQAINIVCRTVLNPGDEVVIPSPSFFFYGMIELVGAVPIYVPTDEEQSWAWDLDRIEAAITPRTKLLILCTPVNPTGYVVPESTIRGVLELARSHNFLVLADESYDRMVYDGVAFTSTSRFGDFRDRLILIQSVTKSYAMSAWRVGYLVAEHRLSDEFTKLLEWEVLYGNVVCQVAAAAAISGPQDWLSDIGREFEGYRNDVWPEVASTEGLSCVKPEATPYMFVNVSGLGVDGDDFADTLVQSFGVPATGGSHFGSSDHVRIGFGARDAVHRREIWRRVRAAAAQGIRIRKSAR
jgi:aspartate/methionine/tyrosine aminotransferase